MLGHPIDRLLHPPVFSVPEHEQGPDHVASEARLLPAMGLCSRVPPYPALHLRRGRTCEGAVVQLVEVKKFLAGSLYAVVRGEPHLTQKHQGPNRGCPLGRVTCPSVRIRSGQQINRPEKSHTARMRNLVGSSILRPWFIKARALPSSRRSFAKIRRSGMSAVEK